MYVELDLLPHDGARRTGHRHVERHALERLDGSAGRAHEVRLPRRDVFGANETPDAVTGIDAADQPYTRERREVAKDRRAVVLATCESARGLGERQGNAGPAEGIQDRDPRGRRATAMRTDRIPHRIEPLARALVHGAATRASRSAAARAPAMLRAVGPSASSASAPET